MAGPLTPATTLLDCYKLGHADQYPEGTSNVYSNLTPRSSRIEGQDEIVWFGLQMFLDQILDGAWADWFALPEETVVAAFERRTAGLFNPNPVTSDRIRALHRLGYLPVEIKSLPEGTVVPVGVPVLTIENTHPDFAWLTNYLETILSTETWLASTSATTSYRLRTMLDRFAEETSDTPEAVDFQAHDFSMRGMSSLDAACRSGAAHLLSFAGTDTVPALDYIEHHYTPTAGSWLGGSVPATEHSVMSAGGQETEMDTFIRLLDLYPAGIVSVVSDTWDLWNVLTVTLPKLRDRIMVRDGKLVIRPDSGDPADILCGDPNAPADSPARAGVIQLLWDTFGGEVNSKGFKVLDSHVGAIYGDSITYERAEDICRRLADAGFASTNIVFGVGSFTYTYVTRDTYGFAMKATSAVVNGERRDLFKDPVTDAGVKKSARGRLAVTRTGDTLTLTEQATPEQEAQSLLRTVWSDGRNTDRERWETVVDRVGKRVIR